MGLYIVSKVRGIGEGLTLCSTPPHTEFSGFYQGDRPCDP